VQIRSRDRVNSGQAGDFHSNEGFGCRLQSLLQAHTVPSIFRR